MKTVDEYIVRGEAGKLKIAITATTYDTAVRAGKAILKVAPEFGTVNIKNRKGELLKVVKRE